MILKRMVIILCQRVLGQPFNIVRIILIANKGRRTGKDRGGTRKRSKGGETSKREGLRRGSRDGQGKGTWNLTGKNFLEFS